jgi:nitrogenase molybdenum-iron protein NifN
MARVVTGGKQAAIDPLKHSQPLGGALVFLGLARTMPIMHGSQGCASFAKALLTRHFREPIPLQTTAVTEVSAVLDGGEVLAAALDAVRGKQRPEIIGVLTTGLTEVNGEDVAGELRTYLERVEAPDDAVPLIVAVSTPDFRGGLSDGWSAALEALVRAVPLDPPPHSSPAEAAGEPVFSHRLAVLAGAALCAADLDEIAELVRAFGLDPVLVPDLSGSIDGHLADSWSPLTTGGTTLEQLRGLGACDRIAGIGPTTAAATAALAERTGAAATHYRHLCGLGATDALVADLATVTGAHPPASVRRWRARLADGLLDSHFVLGGARIALALEPDLLLGVSSLLRDAGAEIVTAISPTTSDALKSVPCEEVVVGDLDDLEQRADEAGAELILASSHARAVAERIGIGHLVMGFPVYDRLGAALQATAGYRGSLRLLVEVANRLLDHRELDHSATMRSESTVKESMC